LFSIKACEKKFSASIYLIFKDKSIMTVSLAMNPADAERLAATPIHRSVACHVEKPDNLTT